ncbi:ORFx protein [NL63-related bat coronavirus]|uniref:ORFx protein n=1 Tax=NL63-related bat coronavirus TaxID=1920748 RepID=A0A1L2KJI2_9ALPC|nr:ORFx protein [NL63-related bat coronavirus]APD51480.1 ORFx protein [NL63-related bat coronavirus]
MDFMLFLYALSLFIEEGLPVAIALGVWAAEVTGLVYFLYVDGPVVLFTWNFLICYAFLYFILVPLVQELFLPGALDLALDQLRGFHDFIVRAMFC